MPENLLANMDITDFEALGIYITELALGYQLDQNNQIPPVSARVPIGTPKSLDEFKDQVTARGIGTVRDNVKGFAVVQYSSDTLLLRLPPKDILEAGVVKYQNPQGSAGYDAMPPFYVEMLLSGEPQPEREDEGMEQLDFWYSRIGDYTISLCG